MKKKIQYVVFTTFFFGYVVYGLISGHVGLGRMQRWEFCRDTEPGAYWLWLSILVVLGLISLVELVNAFKDNRIDNE